MKVLCLTLTLLLLGAAPVLAAEGRFRVEDSIVHDVETGYLWMSGPDIHMEWSDAREWAEGLGDEWRLPMLEELAGLFGAGVTDLDWEPFEDYGRMDAWCLEPDAPDTPQAFDFYEGVPVIPPPDASPSPRVFAVRTL